MLESKIVYDTVIIYNKMNMTAVIAAAICMKEMPDAIALDVTQLVPDDCENYFWIGVDPKENVIDFWQRVKTKNHVVLIDDAPLKPLFIQLNPFKTKFPEQELIDNSDHLKHKVTLIKKAVDHFELKDELFSKLDFHVARFYDKCIEVEFLTFVYMNLLEAQNCLDSKMEFKIQITTDKDIERYLNDVKIVKSKFANSHMHTTVLDGEKVRHVLQTAFSDFNVHLALRLSKLVHMNFLNMTMGMSGAVAYTNMRHIVFEKNVSRPLVLN